MVRFLVQPASGGYPVRWRRACCRDFQWAAGSCFSIVYQIGVAIRPTAYYTGRQDEKQVRLPSARRTRCPQLRTPARRLHFSSCQMEENSV